MGELLTYTIAGGGFILIGGWEAILSSSETLKSPDTSDDSSSKSHSLTFLFISLLSFFFIVNSFFSLFDALNLDDHTGLVLQLEVISIAALFLLYSVLGFLNHVKRSPFSFPLPLLSLLCLFAFVEEFIMFYLQKKDPIGIENRYFDLLLVPISVCVFATMLELKNPDSGFPRLGRAIGLILHGMWFVQMGISFFSDLIVHGCNLHEKSRGNFTIRCKGHPEYHRGKAIATLQFNCHLALLVAFVVGAYAVVCKKHGVRKESTRYRPIGAEMLQMDSTAQFTLDSDDEGDEIENKIKNDAMIPMHKALTVVQDVGANGYGSRH
ncbi:hypothetical protein ACET3Z_015523 [Daucus carota]